MKLYIEKRAITGFFTSLIILFLLGYYTYKNNQDFVDTDGMVLRSNEVLQHIEQANSNAIRIEELVAKYLITLDSTYLKLYQEEIDKARIHYLELRELTGDNIEQQVLIDSLQIVGRKKILFHREIIKIIPVSRERAELMISSLENNRLSNDVYSIIRQMAEIENNLLESRVAASLRGLKKYQLTFVALMVVNFIIISIVFLIINNSFKIKLRAERQANQINAELEAFTYSVSHDLRAPLRSIRGFTEVLKDEFGEKVGTEGNRLLDTVMRNASRMGQLIDDLLNFSRIGRKGLSISTIDMHQLVEEVIHELTIFEKRNIQWDIKPLNDTRGDLSMMKQVWINLISNALKYTRTEMSPRIEIGSYAENGRTVFYVKDNGVGFDMKYSDKLFKVFQRLHNLKDFEGTGVGLALTHRIISKHNGKVWVESEVNKGTTFFFYTEN